MDQWKFYDITHRDHVLCNPMTDETLARLIELVQLPRDARVIDIACGKGEFLVRLVEAYGVRGVGVDLSPFFVSQARANVSARVPDADLQILEMDGAEFEPAVPESAALAACFGASWIYSGHEGTLRALIGMTAPGGWVIAGEPYWHREPSPEYLEITGVSAEDFATYDENIRIGERLGLESVTVFDSSGDGWDRYETLQWAAADAYARAHPEDPDAAEVLDSIAKSKEAYVRWGRDTLGWAIYVFRRPAA